MWTDIPGGVISDSPEEAQGFLKSIRSSKKANDDGDAPPGFWKKMLSRIFGIDLKQPNSADEAVDRISGQERLQKLSGRLDKIQKKMDNTFDYIPVVGGAWEMSKGQANRDNWAVVAGFGSSMFDAFGGEMFTGAGKWAFGFKDDAIKLAEKIGGNHLMGMGDEFKQAFMKIIDNNKAVLHFSLDDIDQPIMKMVQTPTRSSTNWEMHQLYHNPKAFEKTIFHYQGKTYVGFEALKIKP